MASDRTEYLERRVGELEHENQLLLQARRDQDTEHREALAYIAVLEAQRPPIPPRDDRPDPLFEDEAKERRNPSRDPYEVSMGEVRR